MSNSRMFLLMKPESATYVQEIEPLLKRHNLAIESWYFISDWVPVARELYRERIAAEPPGFRAGFEGHLWLSSFLFGRKAILLVLRSDDEQTRDLISLASKANQAKADFRNLLSHTRDGRIVIAMNLERIESLYLYNGSVRGYLGIQQQDGTLSPLAATDDGLWDYFYLKYIHVPFPNVAEIHYEWNTLIAMNVLDERNRLSDSDWQRILALNAFVPPRSVEQHSEGNL